jgi:hypothetical protein
MYPHPNPCKKEVFAVNKQTLFIVYDMERENTSDAHPQRECQIFAENVPKRHPQGDVFSSPMLVAKN